LQGLGVFAQCFDAIVQHGSELVAELFKLGGLLSGQELSE